MKTLFISLFASCLFLAGLSADEPASVPVDQGFTQTLVMVAIAIFFFYFILWRPEQKKRKMLDAQRSAMKKGDRVLAMGILGTVSKIKDETVIVRMVDGAEVEFLKAAISQVYSDEEAGKKE
ncbi:MAG: preprotein translocase subunit YajC [Verrucomicrobia bacterium]|nr:preprotein translocase subunit YajC [Verrucomicrobiota bacterium]